MWPCYRTANGIAPRLHLDHKAWKKVLAFQMLGIDGIHDQQYMRWVLIQNNATCFNTVRIVRTRTMCTCMGWWGQIKRLPLSDGRAFASTACCVVHIRLWCHSSISRHNGAGGIAPTLQPGGSRIESVWTMHFSEWFFDAASPWWHCVSASLLHVVRHSRHDYGASWYYLFILPMVST